MFTLKCTPVNLNQVRIAPEEAVVTTSGYNHLVRLHPVNLGKF